MGYTSLESCLIDLEKIGQLVRIKDEVDPHLEMAAIHEAVYLVGGPALLFEKVKGSPFRAASNIFGTIDRSRFLFRDTLEKVQQLIRIKNDPSSVLKHPFQHLNSAFAALTALPLKNPIQKHVTYQEVRIQDLPLIKHWPMDGGAFITLPQVYSEDIDHPGIMRANLGMYRIQLSGNDYILNKEIGLHYQIHRGIGVHQTKANKKGKPLNVSIFVGGPPAHTIAAVMPLPEGLSEMTFAGLLAGRRFRYFYDQEGSAISADADFVITGEIHANKTKPEGPFGDHLGYYSLTHPFPFLKVKKVYARKNAIWPFTVVGRPPQEDTSFGQLIHEMTGEAIPKEIPGLKEIHAVDAAGVHPLLLAIGSERYTPFLENKQPAELLTIAHHILGTGQLSLAKYLFITADETEQLSTHHIPEFFQYMLERIQWNRDIHFQTHTTMDTLDYSGTGFNSGSKVVFASYGPKIRTLSKDIPKVLNENNLIRNAALIMPGIVAIQTKEYTSHENAIKEIEDLNTLLSPFLNDLSGTPLLILSDQATFTAETLNNFLWITFTRSNPSHDIYGIKSFYSNKHWGCYGPLIIDARKKPQHAPELVADPEVKRRISPIVDKILQNI